MGISFFGNLFRKKTVLPRSGFLIVGLGNPGSKYDKTRHNAGFMILDTLESRLKILNRGEAFDSLFVEVKTSTGEQLVLVKPLCFMNRSGEVVKRWVEQLGKSSTDVLIIVDDFNISLGSLRFRQNGSAGGHNGLKSIIGLIGSEFPRLRIGIGPLPENTTVIDFVLGTFLHDEFQKMGSTSIIAADGVLEYVENGIVAAMSRFNG